MGFLLMRTAYLVLLAAFLFVVGWGILELYRKYKLLKHQTEGKNDAKIIDDINNLDTK
jgi:hypothetical protein